MIEVPDNDVVSWMLKFQRLQNMVEVAKVAHRMKEGFIWCKELPMIEKSRDGRMSTRNVTNVHAPGIYRLGMSG